MEHCIDIEERTVNDYIVQKINKDLSGSQYLDLNCCIHRVGEGLCKVKHEAYEPMVVSIGPYHLKNPKLKAMKKHKLRYLHLLLERRNENVNRYVVELKKLEDRVRECYAEPIDDLNSGDFVEMMLLDACFIIEFFRKNPFNAILNGDYMDGQICRDLMLFENQLPFFLLSHFYDMIKNPDNPNNGLEDPVHDPEYPGFDPDDLSLQRLALSSFSSIIPPPCLDYLNFRHDPGEIKHLLHLVYVYCRPLPKQTERNTKNYMLDDTLNAKHGAVELQEAGVKFKVIGEYYSSKAHLFHIKFNIGSMEVPCFSVDHGTDTFFRNLIAFEQHSVDIVPKYFTEYVDFMNQLIGSEKDVKLLRDEGIIVNHLGDDKEVSNLFNKLCVGVVVPYPTSYADVRKEANKHRNKPWNKMRATLVGAHNYFDTPWATASTIAAVVLLLLTLLQTIAAFKYK